MPASASRLSLYLATAYALLAIYGSLYPFAGWRDSGAPLTSFLTAAWPRYYTGFDLAINIAAYVPLGFFWITALRRWWSNPLAFVGAILIGLILSGGLEIIQNYLPSRVASNLDLACNLAGMTIGALLGLRWGAAMLSGGRIARLRTTLLAERRGVDSGLILLGLWLLAQLDPAVLPFGTGGIRHWLSIPSAQEFTAERFRQFEMTIAATGSLAFLMIASLLTASRQRRLFPPVLLLTALAIKTLAFALLLAPTKALAWATPGTLYGLGIAALVWLLAARLAPAPQRAVAAMSLLLATTIVNLGPDNPYLEYSLQIWNPGQFLNFHGLTHFAASVWPFIALPWLMLLSTDDS